MNTRMWRTLCCSALATVLLGTGCSSNPDTAAPEAAGAPSENPGGGHRSGGGSDGKDRKDAADKSGRGTGKRSSSGTGEEDDGSVDEGSGDEGSTQRWGAASLKDPTDDLDSRGDAPGYVDLTSVKVEEAGDGVGFEVSSRASFPNEMPDPETNALVVVGFDKAGDEYFVQAEASTDGWATTMSRNGRSVKFGGDFSIEGSRMSFSLPWGLIGGRSTFAWSVDSSWTRTTMLDTFYAFDRSPQFERQPYPG
jgi:hypothetical protein